MRRAKKGELGTADPIGRGLFSNSLPNATSDVTASNGIMNQPPRSKSQGHLRPRSVTGAGHRPCAFSAAFGQHVPPCHRTVVIISHLHGKSDISFLSLAAGLQTACKMPYSSAHAVRPWPTVTRFQSVPVSARGLYQPALPSHHSRNRRGRPLHHRSRQRPLLAGEESQSAPSSSRPGHKIVRSPSNCTGPSPKRCAMPLRARIARREFRGHQHGLSRPQNLQERWRLLE